MILLWPLASSIKGPSVNKHFSTKKETLESQMRSVQVIEPESGWKSMEIILFTWDIFTLSGKTQDQDVQECVASSTYFTWRPSQNLSKSWISSRIPQVSSHCPNQWHRPVVHGSLQDGLAPARLVIGGLPPARCLRKSGWPLTRASMACWTESGWSQNSQDFLSISPKSLEKILQEPPYLWWEKQRFSPKLFLQPIIDSEWTSRNDFSRGCRDHCESSCPVSPTSNHTLCFGRAWHLLDTGYDSPMAFAAWSHCRHGPLELIWLVLQISFILHPFTIWEPPFGLPP